MMRSLLRFELSYHFRQVTFLIAAFLFFMMGMLAVQMNFGGTDIYKNSPYVAAVMTSLLSLNTLFPAIIFAGNVLIRDSSYKTEPLLFTTAITRPYYFFVRFAGFFTAVFLLLLLMVTGVMIGTVVFAAHQSGPFHLYYYIHPLVVFGLPNVLFVNSLLFSISLLTRNVKAIYVGGVLIYVLYLAGSVWGQSPLIAGSAAKTGLPSLSALLVDPFGLSTFFGVTRLWNTLQKNQQVFALSGGFLFNRLLWTGISCSLLLLTYKTFPFRQQQMQAKRLPVRQATPTSLLPYHPVDVHPYGNGYYRRAILSQFKLEVSALLKHIPFGVMLLLWAVLLWITLKDSATMGFYGMRFYPFTGIIVAQLLDIKFALLLIIFYVAEISGRERSANIQGLLYSTPVPDMIMWGAKCGALALLVFLLITVNIGTGIGLQLSNNYRQLELPLYGSLYYYSGLPLFLFAILALFIQTLAGSKYSGLLLNVMAAGLIVFSKRIGITHYLLRYASVPKLEHSYMNGFGHYATAFNWYMLYWGGLALLLALGSIALWNGGGRRGPLASFQSAWRQRGRVGNMLLLAGLLTWVTAGAYVYYQTNLIGKYQSPSDQEAWQVGYERAYAPLARISQPDITALKAKIDLYPSERRYTVKGSYQLKNNTDSAIRRIWVGIEPSVTKAQLWLPGATLQQADKLYEQYWYLLKTPLLPGQELSLQFQMDVVRNGFVAFNNEHSLVANGSYVELAKYLPFIGYNGRLQCEDAIVRKAAGLAEQVTDDYDTTYHLVDIDATVSTAGDQYVCMPGVLKRSWQQAGRRYFHYQTEAPINFAFALSSARYAIKREQYKGVSLSIFYQEGYAHNLESMMQGMKDALDYCSEQFMPYPFTTLSIAEIPQYRGTATAYPGMIFSAEQNNFLSDFRDSNKLDYAYATVLHEVSHQWWAHTLVPAGGPGYKMLTESLAKYTEAVVMERKVGPLRLRQYMQADNSLYMMTRGSYAHEPALVNTIDESFVCYQKGAMAFYAIKESIGEKQVNAALRQLVYAHVYPFKRAIPEDLVQALYQYADTTQRRLIDEQLRQVIVYDLAVKVLSCERVGSKYHLQVRVDIQKNRQLDAQPEQPLAINDIIPLAIFDQESEVWIRPAVPIYLERTYFHQASTMLTLVLDRAPAMVAIDPYAYIPDGNQQDNIAIVPR
ncbi:hypothetical protein KTO58_20320 [Chitinophaga pendula]|uniref:M1 family aminopeptidase n=1 Tax=Chitinophaga TaxID=79328 RepID=UPI000BAFC7D6|nr:MULTISPECIES: M1 family aminopeptidase [Chitinophaga]ASZ10998.1 hypothetical protein CK934_08495 [Chitinophaga sp. MD30]UCJ06011.1 hypothetical protein KTO58_20320 [Chitinophaga pendula]